MANDGEEYDQFGYPVSLSVDRALIGAHRNNKKHLNSGYAYVFDFVENEWLQSQKLTPSNAGALDFFGSPVSLFGGRVIIGAYLDD